MFHCALPPSLSLSLCPVLKQLIELCLLYEHNAICFSTLSFANPRDVDWRVRTLWVHWPRSLRHGDRSKKETWLTVRFTSLPPCKRTVCRYLAHPTKSGRPGEMAPRICTPRKYANKILHSAACWRSDIHTVSLWCFLCDPSLRFICNGVQTEIKGSFWRRWPDFDPEIVHLGLMLLGQVSFWVRFMSVFHCQHHFAGSSHWFSS